VEGQIKPGVRNAIIILLIVAVMVPALKVGVNKYGEKLPDWLVNWINTI
jgi:hypothetical protein